MGLRGEFIGGGALRTLRFHVKCMGLLCALGLCAILGGVAATIVTGTIGEVEPGDDTRSVQLVGSAVLDSSGAALPTVTFAFGGLSVVEEAMVTLLLSSRCRLVTLLTLAVRCGAQHGPTLG